MTDVRRLPGTAAGGWDWQLSGACRSQDPAIFFHPDGERGRARASRERAAKRVCGRCPVLRQCRTQAVAAQEPYGVWGGLTERERAAIIRHTERARAARPVAALAGRE